MMRLGEIVRLVGVWVLEEYVFVFEKLVGKGGVIVLYF